MYNIDLQFLKELEGFTLHGYIPKDKQGGAESGVTIGLGIDLGYQSEEKLYAAGVSQDIIAKVKPYLRKTGRQANTVLAVLPLYMRTDEAEELSEKVFKYDLQKTVKAYNKSAVIPFADLSRAQQTVIASVAHQYGNLRKRTPNFWRQVTSGEWREAVANLLDFGDDYRTRRHKEAALLASSIYAV